MANMNPFSRRMMHKEQLPDEFFLGYFDPGFAEKSLAWKTKRIGTTSLDQNGLPYPETLRPEYRPVPVFVARVEVIERKNKLFYGI